MKKVLMSIILLSGIICSCSQNITVEEYKPASPVIFPDYKDVVVPSNIAPMNFVVEEPSGKMVLKVEYAGEVAYQAVKDGEVRFGKRFWVSL